LILPLLALTATAQYYPQDSILFEVSTVPVYIDNTLPANIWQIGTPQKSYLDAAWSPPLGIITGTTGTYPVNTYSIFSFTIDSASMNDGYGTYISFMQKYDTDTLLDRGTIEVSYNGGGVWCVLGNFSWPCPDGPEDVAWDPDSAVVSHKLYNHTEVTSGKSDGWLFSRCHLYWIIFDKASGGFFPDSIMVRFIFTSDGSDSGKDGWLIDNIEFGYEDYWTGMEEAPGQPGGIAVAPNPVTSRSVIRHHFEAGPVNFTIHDRTGRVVLRKTADPGQFAVDRQDLKPGVYLLCAESQSMKRTTRFVVK
jgi:hypothetical protein